MIDKFNYILVVAAIAILSIILVNTNNKVEIEPETLQYIELDRSNSLQEKKQRQYLIVIMFQQVGYLLAIILMPVGFSIYQNRATLKRFKSKLENVFKVPSITKRKTLAERLIVSYPQLTPNDLHLCELVYQGLSSKEIANQLNISPSSANTGRYRLRKKINIRSDEELMSFLHKI